MFELLVPAEPAQLAKAGGDPPEPTPGGTFPGVEPLGVSRTLAILNRGGEVYAEGSARQRVPRPRESSPTRRNLP